MGPNHFWTFNLMSNKLLVHKFNYQISRNVCLLMSAFKVEMQTRMVEGSQVSACPIWANKLMPITHLVGLFAGIWASLWKRHILQ